MRTNIYVLFSLVQALGFTVLYGELKEYFNRPEPYIARIEKLKETVEQEKFKHLVTSYEFQDFRTHVATILPQAIKEKKSLEKSYPLRSLASVVQKGNSETINNYRSQKMYDDASALYRAKEYAKAAELFERFMREHPYSANMPNAMFLTVDSYYNLRKYQDCIATYEKMVDLYPELEVTGFAMLNVGRIYEYYDRHNEAIELYQTVLKTFRDPRLVQLANLSLKKVEL